MKKIAELWTWQRKLRELDSDGEGADEIAQRLGLDESVVNRVLGVNRGLKRVEGSGLEWRGLPAEQV